MSCRILHALLCVLCLSAHALAQPVQVGGGSYAADLPANAPDNMHQFAQRELYIDAGDRPIPTNDWWTDAIAQRWAGELWAHPVMARADERGLRLFYPTRWTDDGRDLVREFELRVCAEDFAPTQCRVTGWGDWSVDLTIPQGNKAIDVTLAHGMPCIWTRYSAEMRPTVELPESVQLGGERLRLEDGETARAVVFNHGERWWAIVMSGRSDVERDGGRLVFRLDPRARFLVFVALPDAESAELYARHALARPTDTRLNWTYEPEASRVVTTWQVDTEPLLGEGTAVLQGWLPHHLRESDRDFETDDVAGTFATPRGALRMSAGNRFELAYPFEGVLPHWPGDPANAELKERADYYTRGYIDNRLAFAPDTYWGGKDLWRTARYGQIASEYGLPAGEALFAAVKQEIIDWLTYTPGENDRYFAAYPDWGGLVGVTPSYGSEAFNDHHFHYGYFLCTGGLIAMHDPQFAEDYGPMLRLIAQDYAGWDREGDLPYLRSFDPWNGHSWAAGMSAPGGNNQESSSEAVQGWAGLIFLGQALGDEDMLATGVMGYATETRAVLEYWFDWKNENWPEQWNHGGVGMIWSGGQLYGTYFSGDPAWVYGIQWFPTSPILMFLARDPDAATGWLESMWAERAAKQGPGDAHSLGPELGNIVLGFQALFDPQTVAHLHEKWFDAGDPMARQHYIAGLVHLYAKHLTALGRPDLTCRTNCPTAVVYRNDQNQRQLVAYNLSANAMTVQVWENEIALGTFDVPPGSKTVTEIE